ncbi:hypothetical protein ANTQUA_LOCUS10431 [Anthophora quadrimaculata]
MSVLLCVLSGLVWLMVLWLLGHKIIRSLANVAKMNEIIRQRRVFFNFLFGYTLRDNCITSPPHFTISEKHNAISCQTVL